MYSVKAALTIIFTLAMGQMSNVRCHSQSQTVISKN